MLLELHLDTAITKSYPYLEELQAYQAGDQRSGRRDRRNDFASNLLCRVPVGRVDTVVHRAEIRRSSDEVDVMVSIVILLELNGVEAVASQRRRSRELGNEVVQVGV